MAKHNRNRNPFVGDLYGSMTPGEFLDYVAKLGGYAACVRKHPGTTGVTWSRWAEKAMARTGLRLVWATRGAPGAVVDDNDDEVKPEVDETLREKLDALPEMEKQRPIAKELREQAAVEMQAATEHDPRHDKLGHKLPKNAKDEDVPRVFCGGLHGGSSNKPGKLATTQELVDFYLQETNVKERIHRVRLRVVPGKEYAVLHPLSDFHMGDRECDFSRAMSLCDWIGKHEGHYMSGVGDYWQSPSTTNVRSATMGFQSLTMQQGIQVAEGLFSRLHRRGSDERTACLLLGLGNHEKTILRSTGQDICPLQWLCERMNVPYAPYDFPLQARVGDQEYLLYMHHGAGGGQTWGAHVNSLERLANNHRDADAVIMAHNHVKLAVDNGVMRVVKNPDPDGLDEYMVGNIPMFRTGSLQRYHPGGYAREKNMKPTAPGSVAIRLYGNKHDIHSRS